MRRPLRAVAVVLAFAFAAAAQEPPAAAPQPPDAPPTHLIKVLRTTNKAQTNRYIPKVYSIRNTNPYNLFRWVRRTTQIEEGAYYFFAEPGEQGAAKSGKIVLILPEYMFEGVDRMMAALDLPGVTSSAGEEFFYFRPKHRHVNDAGFVNLVRALRGNSGDVEADEEANMLLVYAAPSKTADVKAALPLIDVPPPQVMVEVAVYEIAVDNESRIGLDYVAWKNGPGRNLFAAGFFHENEKVFRQDVAPALLDSGTGGTYGLPGHRFNATGANAAWFLDVPSAFFDFLVVKGKARLMTAAKVAARNLVPARVRAGDTILYYRTQVGAAPQAGVRPAGLALDPLGTTDDAALPASRRYEFPDNRTVVGAKATRVLSGAAAGIELTIVPIVGEQETSLSVKVGVVSHLGFDDKGVPLLAERVVETDIQARDGQEFTLGGFAREVFVERADKVPFLGSLPLIGYLFGSDANRTERRQVVVVLSVHRVADFSAMAGPASRVDAALIKSKALRERATETPKTEVGFDQWLLDAGE